VPTSPLTMPGPAYWRYTAGYPWSDWIDRTDFAVYLLARMMLIVAREVNLCGREDGLELMDATLAGIPAPLVLGASGGDATSPPAPRTGPDA
jgi:hypothetical protein